MSKIYGNIIGGNHQGALFYGVATTSGTAITVTADNFSLETGARILIKFSADCEMSGATLNVNSTGAKIIKNPADMTLGQRFLAGKVYEFVYDGTNYEPVIAPMGWGELESQGNRPNIQVARCNAGGSYLGWVRIVEWDSTVTNFNGQVFNIMLGRRYAYSPAETYLFSICAASEDSIKIAQLNGANQGDGQILTKLRMIKSSTGKCYLEYYVPTTTTTQKGANSVLVRIDGTHGEAFFGKIIVGGTVSTESNPTVLASVDIAPNGSAETHAVLYDVNPANYQGIYCNGETVADSTNSITVSDPNKVYKRLKIYAYAPYGLMSTDFSLSATAQGGTGDALFGTRLGSLMGFGSDHDSDNPANKHVMYQMNFAVTEVTAGWTVQVIESGWLSFGIPALSATDFSDNVTAKQSGTEYPYWCQRHNNNYLIYKIVGYTD